MSEDERRQEELVECPYLPEKPSSPKENPNSERRKSERQTEDHRTAALSVHKHLGSGKPGRLLTGIVLFCIFAWLVVLFFRTDPNEQLDTVACGLFLGACFWWAALSDCIALICTTFRSTLDHIKKQDREKSDSFDWDDAIERADLPKRHTLRSFGMQPLEVMRTKLEKAEKERAAMTKQKYPASSIEARHDIYFCTQSVPLLEPDNANDLWHYAGTRPFQPLRLFWRLPLFRSIPNHCCR